MKYFVHAINSAIGKYFLLSAFLGIILNLDKKTVKGTLITFLIIFLFSQTLTYPQSNEDCLMCHDDEEFTMEKDGKEISVHVSEETFLKYNHSELKCVSCHLNFDDEEIPHSDNLKPKSCTDCHSKEIVKHLFHPRILKASGIEKDDDVNCAGCHGYHYVADPNKPGGKWSPGNLANSCGKCHEDESKSYLKSEHYIAFTEGILGAPGCLHCHKNPVAKIHVPEDSLSVKIFQEELCLSCHLDSPEVRSRTTPSAGFITMYDKSVHGSALKSGNHKAANCVDCHRSHEVLKSTSNSPISKKNLPITCGQCHEDISKEYLESIHGVAVKKGIKESPTCTDCHGEHNILKHDDPESPVAFQNLSREVCSPCHSSLKLSAKYGIATDRYNTFSDSYHGLAIEGGSVEVANCASCHGDHDIKPSDDPTSSINKANLVGTCGECHPGANVNFTIGKIHVERSDEDEPILYLIATIYIILISTTIGTMFLHNVFDFFSKARTKKLKQQGIIREEIHSRSLYLRMTINERIQHIILAISFTLLVITGFMLSYPNAWWVSHIRDLSSHTFELRSLIHRIAAVILIAVSLYHIYYVIFTKRGRKLFKDLLPKIQDIKDAIGVAKFTLGISNIKPKFDRFSYVEKIEYWALIWGTILMTLTGVIMWFDNTFIGLFTKFGWDIARTIHYYEAWLAFLAIVVWHFYSVIFNPDVYPMSLTWLKGTISEEEMAENHPLEYERLKKKEGKQSADNEDNN